MENIKVKYVVLALSYVIALTGFLSVVGFIDNVSSLIFVCMFVLSLIFEVKGIHPIPRVVLNIISLLVVGIMFFTVNLEDPVTPVTETLLILLGIKLLEDKKFRDYMQIYTVSVFLLAGSALMTIDMKFLLFFTALFFLVVVSMILLTFLTQDNEISFPRRDFFKIILKTLFIPLLSIPITVLIFLILPRTEYPLFNFLNKQSSGKSGFSDSVQLGDVASIQEDSSVAFRVITEELKGKEPYWRGVTLNYFDGNSWIRISANDGKVYLNGRRIMQEVILEPQDGRYLFGLDKPVKFYNILGRFDKDLSFRSNKINFGRIKYRVESVLTDKISVDSIDKEIYLQVPKSISPEIRGLALSLKGNSKEETMKNIVSFFETQYKHSLENLPTTGDPLKRFLFETKFGNCEYFASSVALFLRINGIPSRLVVGYKGGIYNRVGGYYIVLQKYAHTWVEAYINNSWVFIDPTPLASVGGNTEHQLEKSQFMIMLETLEFMWINFVINFDLNKQISMINNVRNFVKKPEINLNYSIFVNVLLFVLVAFLVISFIYYIKKINRPFEEKILERFIKKMKKKGYIKRENEGLEEFIEKIDDSDLKEKLYRFVKILEKSIYGDKKLSEKEKEEVIRILKSI